MLNNCKSQYIVRIIFSYIYELKKLEIVKYNKRVQKKLDINILNYRQFSGSYIIYESKNKGEEYEVGKNLLIYEGEFLKGKRNGKGIEYEYLTKSELFYKFEGEYLNGKRKGQGKLFDNNGILVTEGEYSDNILIKGKIYDFKNEALKPSYVKKEIEVSEITGKQYDYKSNCIYKGHFKNGKRDGKGVEYYSSVFPIPIYVGEFKNDERNGKGKEDIAGFIYEFNYINGKKHGKGKISKDKNVICEAEYFYGRPWNLQLNIPGINLDIKNGKGIEKKLWLFNFVHENEISNGLANGKGNTYLCDEKIHLFFEGEYLNGMKTGKAKQYIHDKLLFEGEYLYDKRIKGKEYINGRLEFEGEYLYNKKWNGKGFDENGNIIYELIKGTGTVKIYLKDLLFLNLSNYYLEGDFNQLIFEGKFLNGKKNGKPKFCNSQLFEYYELISDVETKKQNENKNENKVEAILECDDINGLDVYKCCQII